MINLNSANRAVDAYSSVGGGSNNLAGTLNNTTGDAAYATIAGGTTNVAGNAWATVSGGIQNTASGVCNGGSCTMECNSLGCATQCGNGKSLCGVAPDKQRVARPEGPTFWASMFGLALLLRRARRRRAGGARPGV